MTLLYTESKTLGNINFHGRKSCIEIFTIKIFVYHRIISMEFLFHHCFTDFYKIKTRQKKKFEWKNTREWEVGQHDFELSDTAHPTCKAKNYIFFTIKKIFYANQRISLRGEEKLNRKNFTTLPQKWNFKYLL